MKVRLNEFLDSRQRRGVRIWTIGYPRTHLRRIMTTRTFIPARGVH